MTEVGLWWSASAVGMVGSRERRKVPRSGLSVGGRVGSREKRVGTAKVG